MALLLALGWLALLLGRQALPPLLPVIIDTLAISPAQAGVALTLMMGCYSLLQYPAGRLSDVLTRKTLLVVSVGGTITGFVILGTVTTYSQLLIGGVLVGVGSAFYFTPSRAFLSDLFTERRGQAFGLQTTAGMTGSALAAGGAVVALEYASWQTAFFPTIVLLFGVGVFIHRWSHESYDFSASDLDLNLQETVNRLFGSTRIRRLLVVRALVGFTFQAAVGFLPTFLQVEKEFTTVFASGSFALVFVVGGGIGPVAGRLSDWLHRLHVVLGGIVIGLLGLVSLLFADALFQIIASVVILAVGLSTMFPVMQAYLMDIFPDDSVGGDFGAAKTVFTGIGSLGPTYVGVIAASLSYTMAYAGLTLLLLLAIALLLTLWDK